MNPLKSLVEKWACKHKWEVVAKTGVRNTATQVTVAIRQTLICSVCGKIKKIRL